MDIVPTSLNGRVKIQPSKSAAHRALCCAALAQGKSVIKGIQLSDDIKATMEGLVSLELANIEVHDDSMIVMGGLRPSGERRVVDCIESGSTLRFLLPLSLIYGGGVTEFRGKGRLMQRPLNVYDDVFEKSGIIVKRKESSIIVSGEILDGSCSIPGNISSQFVTGLLFALPLIQNDSIISLTTKIESGGYIDMTRAMQERFDVSTTYNFSEGFSIKGCQQYKNTDIEVEGDYSHAAFYLVAAAIGGSITLTGLSKETCQGDRSVIDILKRMGADISEDEGGIHVKKSILRSVEIDASEIPDIIPVLSVAACAAEGNTHIYNAGRLKIKECDRLSAVASELNALGAKILRGEDCLTIKGVGKLKGGKCFSHNDHRMAMTLAVASIICKENVELEGFDCVSKSAPAFWSEFNGLGGKAVERNVGK